MISKNFINDAIFERAVNILKHSEGIMELSESSLNETERNSIVELTQKIEEEILLIKKIITD